MDRCARNRRGSVARPTRGISANDEGYWLKRRRIHPHPRIQLRIDWIRVLNLCRLRHFWRIAFSGSAWPTYHWSTFLKLPTVLPITSRTFSVPPSSWALTPSVTTAISLVCCIFYEYGHRKPPA